MQETEKLRRVLNGGGATRFNEISDSVTHIIVGDIVSADLKALKCSGLRYGLFVLICCTSICWICYSPFKSFLLEENLFRMAYATYRLKFICKIYF
jgi:hypothetical protein